MPLEKHNLLEAFPEMRERIHALKYSSSYFAKLLERYESLERILYRIECGAEAASDTRLEELKKQRLSLKDNLFEMLNKAD